MARGTAKLGRSVLDLDVEDGRFVQKLNKAEGDAQKFTDKTGRMVRDAGRAIGGLGGSMTRDLTLPIVGAGAAITKFGLEFDTTMREVVGLTDVTQDQIGGIREQILALGPAVGKGPQELGEAFYFVSSAGFAAEEAMEVLEVSARAAASGLGETQTIAQVLGGVINAYGKNNISAARAADILTEAVSQGTAEASGFASVIGNVVPGAAALGVSFDQVTAAMAGMTLSGVGVEESATSLINIFSSLQKPTKQAEEAMGELGLSSAGLRRQLREEGLLATLRTLEERFAGNETASAAVFGNIRALRGVTALLGLDAEQLNSVFEKVENSQGRAAQAFADTEGPARDLDRALAEMEATGIQLSEDVIPLVVDVLKQLAAGVRGVGDWWRSLDKDTRRAIVQFLAFVAVTGPVLLIVGKLVTALGALITVTKWLTGSKGLSALAGRVPIVGAALRGLLGPIGLLLAAVEALKFGLTQLTDYEIETEFLKAAEATGDFSGALRDAADAAASSGLSLEDFRDRVIEAMRSGMDWAGALEYAADKTRSLSTGLDDTHQSMDDYGERMLGLAGATRDGVDAAVLEAAGLPPEMAATLADPAGEVAGAATELTDDVAAAAQKAREESLRQMRDMISDMATVLAAGPDQIADEAQALADALVSPYADFNRRADLEVQLAQGNMQAAIDTGDTGLQSRVFQQVNDWLAQYELLEPGAIAAGELVNPALESGINSNLDAMLQWVQDNVTGPTSDKFELADTLHELGYASLAAYVRGIGQQEEAARRQAEILAGRAVTALAQPRQARMRGEETGGSYGSGIGSQGWYVGGQAGHLRESARWNLPLDASGIGYNVGWSYGNGLAWSQTYVNDKAAQLKAGVQRFLEFAGSPAYTHSREIGENVALSWGDALGSALHAIDLSREVDRIGSQLGAVPPLRTPTLPEAASVASGAFLASGGTGTAGRLGNEIHYHWELTVDGVPKTVDSAEEAIRTLTELGAFTDGRVVTGG